MSIDFRTRTAADVSPVRPEPFLTERLPALSAARIDFVRPWLEQNELPDWTIECDGKTWQLQIDADGIRVRAGAADNGLHVRLSEEDFSGLVNDLFTPITFYGAGDLDIVRGNLNQFLDWWLVLRAILDERPIHVATPLEFNATNGAPLGLGRAFRIDEPLEEMREFLESAGFLHLQGVFGADEMAALSREMDREQGRYAEGDGRSWWATTADGERRLVRMQAFDEFSESTAKLLEDPRFLRLGEIPGTGYVNSALENNRIEALIKPLHVVQGLSDLPWHKDCAQGRHSFDCCAMTVGVSVTGADAASGQIRVLAGSHRVLMWPGMLRDAEAFGLPVVDLPTRAGDVTIHLSCTHHMAQAPTTGERRVMYTGFRLPSVDVSSSDAARARVNRARENAHKHLSDKASSG